MWVAQQSSCVVQRLLVVENRCIYFANLYLALPLALMSKSYCPQGDVGYIVIRPAVSTEHHQLGV